MVFPKNLKSYTIFIPIFIGIVLLFIPLLGDFHIESALLASLVGSFWGGISACNTTLKKDFRNALRIAGYILLVGLPLLIYAVFTGCFSIDGLAFWLLFPLPSVFFGYAIGRVFRSCQLPYCRLLTTGTLLAIGVGIFLYELFSFPQVYFFNHVWGGWAGPIYDEEVRINDATLFFRILTLLWATLLWHLPMLGKDRYSKWIIGFTSIAILLSYTQLAEFGTISPRPHIQQVLGGQEITRHFELYYDKHLYSQHEIQLLGLEHEFYYQQISNQLDLSPRDTSDKIESYLYKHPWQKKSLVGAKFTSYVPVWLEQDQLHIAKQQLANSLKHELVHVLTKEFGNNLFNASWSTGLIEGIAVAIDGGSSPTTTVDQLVVSEKPYPTAHELQHAFSPWGFYGGRSGINYTTSGSFVKFLLRNYPAESLKEAYQTGDIASTYSQDWLVLTELWHRHLDSVQVDSVDRQVAQRIWGIPSLFEQKCPHIVSDLAGAWDNYEYHLANQDTAQALKYLDQVIVESDTALPAKTEWSYRNLVSTHFEKVQQDASIQDSSVDLQLLYADAFALTEDWTAATKHLTIGQELFNQNLDSLLRPALSVRQNNEQWETYLQITYHDQLPDSTTFSTAYYRTKIRSTRKAIELEHWDLIVQYAQQLLQHPLQIRYFDDYQRLIHTLGFLNKTEIAAQFINRLSDQTLRSRYKERLQQEKEWLSFLEKKFS